MSVSTFALSSSRLSRNVARRHHYRRPCRGELEGHAFPHDNGEIAESTNRVPDIVASTAASTLLQSMSEVTPLWIIIKQRLRDRLLLAFIPVLPRLLYYTTVWLPFISTMK